MSVTQTGGAQRETVPVQYLIHARLGWLRAPSWDWCVCVGLLVGLRVREIGGGKTQLKCLLKQQRTTLNPFSFHSYRVVPSLEGGEGNFHDVMGTGCYLLSTPPSPEKVNSGDSTV